MFICKLRNLGSVEAKIVLTNTLSVSCVCFCEILQTLPQSMHTLQQTGV